MSKANKKAKKQLEPVDVKKVERSELEKKIFSLTPINEFEGYQFQEMFELNKTFAGYVEQYKMHEFAMRKKDEEIDAYKTGKWSPMLFVMVNKQTFRPIDKLDDIISRLEEEKKTIRQAMDSIRFQMMQKRDEFVECMLRVKSILAVRVKDEDVKVISPSIHIAPDHEQKVTESIEIDLENKTTEQIKKEISDAKEKLGAKLNG